MSVVFDQLRHRVEESVAAAADVDEVQVVHRVLRLHRMAEAAGEVEHLGRFPGLVAFGPLRQVKGTVVHGFGGFGGFGRR